MDEEPATRQDTIRHFVTRSKRIKSVGVRQSFLQPGRGAQAGAGALAGFVRRRDALALDLYLLLLLLGRGTRYGGHYIDVRAGVWTRVLGLEGKSAKQVLSRALGRLEVNKLIRRVKNRKGVRVEILREDASGAEYKPPSGGKKDPYFQIPLEYWLEDHYLTLRTPGKAMLLIALGEQEEFELQITRVPNYYGISTETADRGYEELVRAGIALFDRRVVKDPDENAGTRSRTLWRLIGPFERIPPATREDRKRLRVVS
jgi:hypothetical protein